MKKRAEKFVVPDHSEYEKYIGILLLMGVVRKPSTRDYWKKAKNGIERTPSFAEMMTHKRFQEIERFLHFNDIEDPNNERKKKQVVFGRTAHPSLQ
jgi:hypothetical protein